MDGQSFEKLMNAGAFADSAAFAPPVQDWEPPIPFNTLEVPDFPTEELPGPLATFVAFLADNTQTPDEMGGLLGLGVLSSAFQSKYTVQITPDWEEPLSLFCIVVAPPGERKSAVISALTKPLYEFEAERREREAVEIAQNQTERTLLEKALQAAQNSAAKGKGNFDSKRQEALNLSAQLTEFEDKHPFRLVVDDVTPERLIDLMEQQGGSITMASAEGSLFDTLNGRYDNRGGLDVYLKGHAGDPLSVDRIGRKSNYIAAPRLTLMLTIQPEVLSGLMNNTTFRGRGLCGRFLYAMCRSKIGRREVSPHCIPDFVKEDYRTFIRQILSIPFSGAIRLSPEADEIRKEYQRYIEGKLGNEWENLRDWGGKLVGATVRIATLMHAAEVQGNPTEIPIGAETMQAAVKIAEFLGPHAEAAYQVMGADEGAADAKYLLRRIEHSGKTEISKRDLFNLCKGKFKRVVEMEPALQILTEMGYLKEVDCATGGRPSKKLLINPLSKRSKSRKTS